MQDADHGRVVAADGCDKGRDSGGPGVGRERSHQRRPDAAPAKLVRHAEGDLAVPPARANRAIPAGRGSPST